MMNTAASSVLRRQGASWRRPLLARMITSSSSGSNDTTVGSAFSGRVSEDAAATASTTTSDTICTSESMASFRYANPVASARERQQRDQQPPPPPPTILKPGFQPTGVNKDGVFVGSTFLMLSPQTLPELDVSPLLNKTIFTRKIGTSRHGSDAAIRLYKAKNELRSAIQQELATESTTSRGSVGLSTGQVRKMYILKRHGVPNQLLQHLITTADQWLQDKNALELWLDSSGCNNNNNMNTTSSSSLSVFTADGQSWRSLWPVEWQDDLDLYLAVMKRMVSHLGSMTPFCEGTSVMPGDLEWKVSISRNNKLPLTLFPNSSNSGGSRPAEVLPVVEWITPTTTSSDDSTSRKIGKIVIRMQGATHPIIPAALQGDEYNYQQLKQNHDVSFTFEANFDITDAVAPTRTTTSESWN